MDFGDLRALVLDLNIEAHGVPAVVTVSGESPVTTRGIWLTPITDGFPGSHDFQRRDPTRVFALTRVAVPAVPRGTLIVAPEKAGDADQRWRVEGPERIEADNGRYILIPDTEAT